MIANGQGYDFLKTCSMIGCNEKGNTPLTISIIFTLRVLRDPPLFLGINTVGWR